jgi:hypothetical protein
LCRFIKPEIKTQQELKKYENIKKRLNNLNLMITTKLMRQLWAVIESTQVSTLLQFDDAALVQLLLQQLTAKQGLDMQTDNSINTYIESKLPLIRDTAEGRLSLGQGHQ